MTRGRPASQDPAPPADVPSTKRGFTAFEGHRRLGSGTLLEAALVVRRAVERSAAGPLLIFDDATGQVVDVDLRGSEREVMARLSPDRLDQEGVADASGTDASGTDASGTDASGTDASGTDASGTDASGTEEGPRRRGRPTLGVVAREVTLLPRHWEWLNTQPGGASATLRRLVEEARHSRVVEDQARRAREAAYRFAHAVAGDLPGFEEAARALFAGDRARFTALVAGWPQDVRDYAAALAFAEPPGSASDVPEPRA